VKESEKMDNLPENVTSVTNDTEESFVYQKDGIRTNLSILSPIGDSEGACICHAQYRDGIDEPLKEEFLHINDDEKGLLSELLNKSRFL
jgi:hypothetical protein